MKGQTSTKILLKLSVNSQCYVKYEKKLIDLQVYVEMKVDLQ